MKAFLMIGQSNMAGRGHVGEVPEIRNERCFMLRNGQWGIMTEPVNPDAPIFGDIYGDLHSGVCLATSFADAYANTYKEEVGLIPCAHGGTKIAEWMPGEILFDHAVFMAKLAMRTSELAGILWHQGCQDAVDPQDAAAHFDRTVQVLTAIRRELGAEHLPLLVGELAEFTRPLLPQLDKINEGIRRMPEALPRCALVRTEGLTSNRDGVHIDAASLRTFGLRYFTEYQKLRG